MCRVFSRLFIALLASLLCHGAAAQYPSRPIRLLVPFPPGGGPDLVGRILAPKFSDALGQPVVVENRVGGNGNVAGEAVAKSPGDGHRPLAGNDSRFGINPDLFTGPQRSRVLPEVPAIAEFYPDFVMVQWYGLFAPAGTPEAVLARLRAEADRALALPDVREKLSNAGGVEPWIATPEEFAAELRSQFATYAKLVKDVGAKID